MFKKRFFMFCIVVVLSLALVGLALASDNTAQPISPVDNKFPSNNVSNGIDTGTSLSYPEKSKPEQPQGFPVALSAGITGVSTDYGWSQTSGTYTPIAGGTLVTSSCDDDNYNAFTLPFSFTFNGDAYTTFSIQCNGFIAMGSSVSNSYTPISGGSSNNIIVANGQDLQTNTSASDLRFEVLGSTPNQVLVVQWNNFRYYGTTGDAYNFQIRLYETTNVAEVVYGAFTQNTTNRTVQVGLRGDSNADFNNRTSTTNWLSSVAGTLNTDTMPLTTNTVPPNGLTWTWTPAPPHPIFDTSYKAAPTQVVLGQSIAYTVHVINSGTDDADAATMVDPIPVGTTYNNNVVCSAGVCSYNSGLNRIEWAGAVPVLGDITISFSVTASNVSCGVPVLNQATLDDPGLYGGSITRSASTTPVASIPTPLDGFEVSVPPPGWTETIVNDPGTDPDWSQVASGTFPTINPHSGGWMAKFNSYSAPSAASARLWTNALDLTSFASPQVVFWMSHDTGYSANPDRIQVQVSTDGVSWSDIGAPVYRYDAACSTACWKEHTVALTGYDLPVVYIGFLGISGYGNNFYLDDTALSETWYPCPSFTLGPDGSKAGCLGSTVDYSLNLLNNDPTGDTFDISVSGNDWLTWANPTQLDLGPGGFGLVNVSVQLPAEPGTDTATITALGQDHGATDTATLQTTALSAFWSQIANEPGNGRMDNVTAAYNGFVWSITGYGANTNVRYYDPAADSWTEVAGSNPPFTNNYARSGCTFGNTVYMYGDAGTVGFTGLWSYNMQTNIWAQVTPSGTPPAQTGIWAPAWVSDPDTGYCYLTGGASTPGAGNLTSVYVYDPVTNAWLNPLPSFSIVRDFHAAFIYTSPTSAHKLLCVVGGNSGVGLTSTQCYDFTLAAWNAENADMGALPADLWAMGYADKWHADTMHQLWLVGGVYGGFLSNATLYFDVDTETWVDGSMLESGAIYRTSAVTLDNDIYHLGGSIGSFSYTGLADRHYQCSPLANHNYLPIMFKK